MPSSDIGLRVKGRRPNLMASMSSKVRLLRPTVQTVVRKTPHSPSLHPQRRALWSRRVCRQ